VLLAVSKLKITALVPGSIDCRLGCNAGCAACRDAHLNTIFRGSPKPVTRRKTTLRWPAPTGCDPSNRNIFKRAQGFRPEQSSPTCHSLCRLISISMASLILHPIEQQRLKTSCGCSQTDLKYFHERARYYWKRWFDNLPGLGKCDRDRQRKVRRGCIYRHY